MGVHPVKGILYVDGTFGEVGISRGAQHPRRFVNLFLQH